jgi:cobalamin synthase
MLLLRQLTGYCAAGLVAGFAVVILWKVITGAISLEGLLDSFDGGKRSSSPARMQLLLFTLVAAGQYLVAVWKNPTAGALPAVPQQVLAMVAGSQVLYVGGKMVSTYLPLLRKPN